MNPEEVAQRALRHRGRPTGMYCATLLEAVSRMQDDNETRRASLLNEIYELSVLLGRADRRTLASLANTMATAQLQRKRALLVMWLELIDGWRLCLESQADVLRALPPDVEERDVLQRSQEIADSVVMHPTSIALLYKISAAQEELDTKERILSLQRASQDSNAARLGNVVENIKAISESETTSALKNEGGSAADSPRVLDQGASDYFNKVSEERKLFRRMPTAVSAPGADLTVVLPSFVQDTLAELQRFNTAENRDLADKGKPLLPLAEGDYLQDGDNSKIWTDIELIQFIEMKVYPDFYIPARETVANPEVDAQLASAIEKYGHLSQDDLFIPDLYRIDDTVPFFDAIAKLKQIQLATTPCRKLAAIRSAAHRVFLAMKRVASERKPGKNIIVAGDDFLPVWIYVTMKAGIRSLATECDFIETFMHSALRGGESGYYFTTLQLAVEYIRTLSDDQLKNASPPEGDFLYLALPQVHKALQWARNDPFHIEVVAERAAVPGCEVLVVSEWYLQPFRPFAAVLRRTASPEDTVTVSVLRTRANIPAAHKAFLETLFVLTGIPGLVSEEIPITVGEDCTVHARAVMLSDEVSFCGRGAGAKVVVRLTGEALVGLRRQREGKLEENGGPGFLSLCPVPGGDVDALRAPLALRATLTRMGLWEWAESLAQSSQGALYSRQTVAEFRKMYRLGGAPGTIEWEPGAADWFVFQSDAARHYSFRFSVTPPVSGELQDSPESRMGKEITILLNEVRRLLSSLDFYVELSAKGTDDACYDTSMELSVKAYAARYNASEAFGFPHVARRYPKLPVDGTLPFATAHSMALVLQGYMARLHHLKYRFPVSPTVESLSGAIKEFQRSCSLSATGRLSLKTAFYLHQIAVEDISST